MKKLALFVCLFGCNAVHATDVVGVGTKNVNACSYALTPTVALVEKLHYPSDWTIYVTCNDVQWETMRQIFDATSNYAFTDLRRKRSMFRGEMFRTDMMFAQVSSPKYVFAHELGHCVLLGQSQESEMPH